jgi:RNA polymerase sigma factor for flagellar operon FliA
MKQLAPRINDMSTRMHSAVKAYHKVCKMDLRDRLILEHLYFVRHILGKMLGGLPDSVDNDNLESAGILGLVEAAGQFDPTRGIAFTTFAYQRIRGAILDELRRNCPVPQAVLQNWTLIREASVHMTPPLTSEKLAARTGLNVEDVDDCIAAMRLTRPEAGQMNSANCLSLEIVSKKWTLILGGLKKNNCWLTPSKSCRKKCGLS